MGGRSHSSTTNVSNTTNNVQNTQIEDVTGVAIVGDGNRVTTTDHGAIQAGQEVALEALAYSAGMSEASLDAMLESGQDAQSTARHSLDLMADTMADSQDTARHAMGVVEASSILLANSMLDANKAALDHSEATAAIAIEQNSQLGEKAINAVSENSENSLDLIQDLSRQQAQFNQQTIDNFSSTTTNAIGSIERMAKSASTNGQSLVADSLVDIFKPLGIGLALVAGAFAIKGAFKHA